MVTTGLNPALQKIWILPIERCRKWISFPSEFENDFSCWMPRALLATQLAVKLHESARTGATDIAVVSATSATHESFLKVLAGSESQRCDAFCPTDRLDARTIGAALSAILRP